MIAEHSFSLVKKLHDIISDRNQDNLVLASLVHTVVVEGYSIGYWMAENYEH